MDGNFLLDAGVMGGTSVIAFKLPISLSPDSESDSFISLSWFRLLSNRRIYLWRKFILFFNLQ